MLISSSPLSSSVIASLVDTGAPTQVLISAKSASLSATTSAASIDIEALVFANSASLTTAASQSILNQQHGIYTPRARIQWKKRIGTSSDLVAGIQWRESNLIDFSIGLEWTGHVFTPNIGIHWVQSDTAQPSIQIEWIGDAAYTYPQIFEDWTVTAKIYDRQTGAMTDISNKLVGRMSIDASEDASSIATFAALARTDEVGELILDTLTYMNDWVIVDVAVDNGTQSISRRRYKGYIMSADYDPETGIIYFKATNDVQGYFEQLDKAAIDSEFASRLGAKNLAFWWSEFFFNKEVTGWEYAQDLLSTTEYSLHLDTNRQLKVTSFKAKATPDITLTDDTRFGGTLKFKRANRRDLINNIIINVDYQNFKLAQKVYQYIYNDDATICERLDRNSPWSSKEALVNAVQSTSWKFLREPNWDILQSGKEICRYSGIYPVYGTLTADSGNWIQGATFEVYKKWVMSSKENYQIQVWSSDSYNRSGNFKTDLDIGIQSEYDYEFWEDDNTPVLLSSSGASYVDWSYDGATWQSVKLGDYRYDTRNMNHKGNQTDLELAQKTAIHHAKTTILKSHRKNIVSLTIPWHPDLDLSKTVEVNTDYLQAKGKVAKVTDVFDFDSGYMAHELSIAVSHHGGNGLTTDTPITATNYPTSSGYSYSGSVVDGKDVYYSDTADPNNYTFSFEYKVGGAQDTVVSAQDDCGMGFYANTRWDSDKYHNTKAEGFYNASKWPVFETTGFVIHFPSITEDETYETGLAAENSFDVAVPKDTLIIKA